MPALPSGLIPFYLSQQDFQKATFLLFRFVLGEIMLFLLNLLLELTMAGKNMDSSAAEASTVDEVDDTDMDRPQFLASRVSDNPTRPVRAFVTDLLALSDRCRDRTDSQLFTQPLQARQHFRRATSLDAFDVGIGQSDHVALSLILVLLALLPPAIRDGELREVFEDGGLRVWGEGLETTEVCLLRHGTDWQVRYDQKSREFGKAVLVRRREIWNQNSRRGSCFICLWSKRHVSFYFSSILRNPA